MTPDLSSALAVIASRRAETQRQRELVAAWRPDLRSAWPLLDALEQTLDFVESVYDADEALLRGYSCRDGIAPWSCIEYDGTGLWCDPCLAVAPVLARYSALPASPDPKEQP